MSKRVRTMAVTAALAVVVAPAQPAHATPDPTGMLCGLSATAGASADGTTWTGHVDAGPVVLDSTTGSVTCTVQLGSETHGDSTNDAVAAPANGSHVVVLPPTPVSWTAPTTEPVYLCTEVTDGGTTLYYDVPSDSWDLDPVTARCLQVNATLGVRTTAKCPHPHMKASHGRGPRRPCPGDDGGETTLHPYYPKGTIEITSTLDVLVPTTIVYTDFTPAVDDWDCDEIVASTTTVTCTPPAAPPGYRNVCGDVSVAATSQSPGAVNGQSRCGTSHATATSNGPTSDPSTDERTAQTSFPWSCSAGRAGSINWKVTCTVDE